MLKQVSVRRLIESLKHNFAGISVQTMYEDYAPTIVRELGICVSFSLFIHSTNRQYLIGIL